MNHGDLQYKGKIPDWANIDGTRVFVPFIQEPTPDASWVSIAAAVSGTDANPKKWLEPVHVAFANLNVDDPEALAAFVKTYGISGRFCNRDDSTGKLFVDPEYIRRLQIELWTLWGGALSGSGLLGIEISTSEGDLSVELTGGFIKVSVRDLLSFIMASFLIDRASHRTQSCEYSRCTRQRYFLKTRADQQFCSTQCRALHNRMLWRTDPKNVEHEKRQRRKARKKRQHVA
jgi:hypothetical protein